MIVL
jgi:hypothetical protein